MRRRKSAMPDIKLGRAIRLERELKKMTLEELAQRADLGVYQNLLNIELGHRKIQMVDLVRISEVLGRDFVGEYKKLHTARPRVTLLVWRDPQDKLSSQRFKQKCEDLFRLENDLSQNRTTRLPAPPESFPPSREDVNRFAEEVRDELGISRCPAEGIEKVLGNRGILIDYAEDLEGPPLVTRGEFGLGLLARKRFRTWDIAQGLFLLLTWDQETKDLAEKSPEEQSRILELAKAFSAAFLLPIREFTNALRRWAPNDSELTFTAVRRIADFFSTSPQAVLCRLVNLNFLDGTQGNQAEKELEAEIRSAAKPSRHKGGERISRRSPTQARLDCLAFRALQTGRITKEEAGKFDISANLIDKALGVIPDKGLELKIPKNFPM